MTFRPPLYMQNSDTFSYAAQDDRFLIDTLFSEGILNVGAGQGLAVQRPEGANMTVYVPPFDAIVKGDDATLQGSYLLRMTVGESPTVTAAPASNSRIDLLVVEVVDSTYRSITTANPEGPRLRVIAGTSAATPTVPTLPPTAIALAQITVVAGQASITTANITDLRAQAGAATLKIGTQAQPLTQAQRAALTGAELYPGRLVENTTIGALEHYTGTAWKAAGAGASGKNTAITYTNLGTTPQSVSFSVGPGYSGVDLGIRETQFNAGGAALLTASASEGVSIGGNGQVIVADTALTLTLSTAQPITAINIAALAYNVATGIVSFTIASTGANISGSTTRTGSLAINWRAR